GEHDSELSRCAAARRRFRRPRRSACWPARGPRHQAAVFHVQRLHRLSLRALATLSLERGLIGRGARAGLAPASTRTNPEEQVMRHIFSNGIALAVALLAGAAGAAGPPGGPLTKCPVDAVVSGAGCMDKYEASVWRVPNPTTTNAALVRKIQLGRASLADLTAGGATQLGTASADYAPCTANGQNCGNDL